MENLSQCKLAVYSDASYNNLESGGSQGGFLQIFIRFLWKFIPDYVAV